MCCTYKINTSIYLSEIKKVFLISLLPLPAIFLFLSGMNTFE